MQRLQQTLDQRLRSTLMWIQEVSKMEQISGNRKPSLLHATDQRQEEQK